MVYRLFRSVDRNTQNIYNIIAYEDLILRHISTIKNLIRFLELDILDIKDAEVSRFIARRSPTAKDAVNRVLGNLYKWKKRLTRQQLESILRVTHAFNLTFYDENIEPNYDEFKTGNLCKQYSSLNILRGSLKDNEMSNLGKIVLARLRSGLCQCYGKTADAFLRRYHSLY